MNCSVYDPPDGRTVFFGLPGMLFSGNPFLMRTMWFRIAELFSLLMSTLLDGCLSLLLEENLSGL